MTGKWAMSMAMVSGALAGCGGGSNEAVDSGGDTGVLDPCVGSVLADDFVVDPTPGDVGDPESWGSFPPDAVVATTYLRLDPEGMARFGEVVGPVIGELMAGPEGLMGASTGQSMRCGVARTLTVWASEEAMMQFVVGEAHSAAMAATGEVSRGGSITTTWSASELGQVDWASAAAGLADHDGPVY